MTRAIPMIIDCDPGQDDAIMLFMALNAPEFDVRGIVAAAGNVGLKRTTRNLAMIVEIAGRGDVALYAGCPRPIMRDLVTAENVHGQTGINGIEIFEPILKMQDQHGVDFIISHLLAADDDQITIVATGPAHQCGYGADQGAGYC